MICPNLCNYGSQLHISYIQQIMMAELGNTCTVLSANAQLNIATLTSVTRNTGKWWIMTTSNSIGQSSLLSLKQTDPKQHVLTSATQIKSSTNSVFYRHSKPFRTERADISDCLILNNFAASIWYHRNSFNLLQISIYTSYLMFMFENKTFHNLQVKLFPSDKAIEN
jgi:hypothetical protein